MDRWCLITKTLAFDDYVSSLAKDLFALSRHHYIAKCQSTFFKDLRTHLEAEKEGLLVLDFAENYSFLVQDAVQGFHWENSQCTVHPLVFYFRSPDGELQHQSFCCFSDGLKHITVMVYAFLKALIPALKNTCPRLEKLHYFYDSCAGQFKNRFNFLNLLHHEQDFHIKAEWQFFATLHGKNACDGIGGTVKRATAKASLQRVVSDQILTPLDMFNSLNPASLQ